MSERQPTLLCAGGLAALLALAGGCCIDTPEPLPPPPPPVEEAYSTPFQPVGDGDFVAASHRHRARVTADGTLYLYLPQGEGRPGTVAALGTQLRSMARGEGPLDTALRPGGRLDQGAVRFDRGSITEIVRNTKRGVEQGWVFPAAPKGEGDLVVRIRTEGVDDASLSAGGIHFSNDETGMRALVEDATWSDARGRTTRVPARYEDGSVVLRVPASLVDASAYPTTLKLGPARGGTPLARGGPSRRR
jgi:hypothetical protein